MKRRSWALVSVLGAAGVSLLLILPLAHREEDPRRAPNGASAAPVARTASTGAGLSRLVSACRAGSTLPYSGVQRVLVVVPGGQRSSTLDVSHVPGDAVRLTLHHDVQAGGTLVGQRTFVGQLAAPSLLPVVDEATLARIASRYAVAAPRPGPAVADRATDVVDLTRTSGASRGSVAARFYLDRRTDLPLRREVFDGAGRVEQSSTYTAISYRRPPSPPQVTTVAGTPPDPGEGVTSAQLDGMRRDGWLAPGRLPDDFDLVDARLHDAPAPVLQLAYTDGISVVSVFEQRGRLDSDALPGWSRQRLGSGEMYVDTGVPARMAWSAHGSVYTVVSDDPSVTDAVVAALPEPSAPTGIASRMHRGADRLLSWINPFG